MKKGAVILKVDSRDRDAHVRFGQTVSFTPESNFGFDLYSTVEPESAVSCTAFSTTKMRSSQTRDEYSIDLLWSKVSSSNVGADPRDTLSTAIKFGLNYLTKVGIDYALKGYFRADTGALRAADNIRSAMTQAQSSAMANTYWYAEWSNTPVLGVMPIGKTKVSAHSWVIVDWKIVNAQTVFLIDSHQGVRRYMPFDVIEEALKESGTTTFIASEQSVLDKRDKTILETIKDVCINLIIALKALLIIKKVDNPIVTPPPVVTIKSNMIEKWAKAIAQWEGDITGHDAGNLKYTTLTKSWGAKQGRLAKDGGYFALFPDDGIPALCNFLTLGCEDELKAFHNARTFEEFTKVYAGNPPQNYIEGIRQILGCELNTDIKTFL